MLRCGKCDRPICTDCVVIGPAGTRCRDCASVRSGPIYQVSADRLVLGALAGFGVAVALGFVLASAFRFGFFDLWLALFFGAAVGETVLRVTARRRARSLEIAAGAVGFTGAIAGLLLYLAYKGYGLAPELVSEFITRKPFFGLSLLVVAFGAISRVRYF